MMVLVGVVGFIMLYVYEMNQILWQKSFFKFFFTGGFILIFGSTLFAFISDLSEISNGVQLITGIILFIIFLYLLIYTLFFAIPFKESYVEQFENRTVYKEKMYALSRHPGVLWFVGLYGSLVLIIPTDLMIILCVVLSLLNIVYIFIQDFWSFPKLFVDYKEYKKGTPFLIPSINSVKKSIQSYRRKT